MKFIHKSSKTHLDADALSRHPIEGEVDEHKDNYVPLCNLVPNEDDEPEPNTLKKIQEAQQQDPKFGEIYKQIKSGTEDIETKLRYQRRFAVSKEIYPYGNQSSAVPA